MLQQMRNEKVMKRVMWALVVLVGIPFLVFYGWSSSRGGRSQIRGNNSTIANINKKAIGYYDFELKKNQLENRIRVSLQQQIGDNEEFIQEQLKKIITPYNILNSIIEEELLYQQALKSGIKVSDKEIAISIANFFGTDDKNELSIYLNRYLKRTGMSESTFTERLRHDIQLAKMSAIINDNVFVSYLDSWDDYLKRSYKAKIKYVEFPISDYLKDIQVDEEGLKPYFEKNKEKYKISEQVDFDFLVIKEADIRKNITLEDKDIKQYYEDNKDKFKEPKQVQLRHIFLKTEPSDTQEKQNEVKKKIDEIAKEVKSGKDFTELAKKYNEDDTKDIGGDLGFNTDTSLPKPIADEAFKMKIGDVSESIRDESGFHIIKVTDIKEEKSKTLEEAKSIIEANLQKDKAQEILEDRGVRMQSLWEELLDFKKVAEALDLKPEQTGFFEKNKLPIFEKIGYIQDFKKDTEIKKDAVLGVFKNYNGYFLIKVADIKPAYQPDITDEKIKDRVKEDYKKFKAATVAQQEAEKFKSSIKDIKEIDELAKKISKEAKVSPEFTQGGFISGIGKADNLIKEAFIIEKDKIGNVLSAGDSEDAPKAYYVWFLDSKVVPDKKTFMDEIGKQKQTQIAQKQSLIQEEWINEKRAQSNIKVKTDFFKPQTE